MRIAIVTEKPHMARLISQVATKLFPNDHLDYPICWPVGIYAPQLPRGLRWRDYPYIAPFGVNQFERRKMINKSLMHAPMVGMSSEDEALMFERSWDRFNSSLVSADRIIFLMDPSPHLYHGDVARQRALGHGILPGEARMLRALDAASIKTALTSPSGEQDECARHLIKYGQVKQYFNHQFAVNSLAIFGRLTEGAWVSKYQLQLLYALKNKEPATEGEWLRRMKHWAGTGRYKDEKKSNSWLGLASPMSSALIWEQVKNHDWMRATGSGEKITPWTISEKGEDFLKSLHPGCEDADLPFRLHAWCEQGLENAQEAIDRYVRSFFGRQKRFMGGAW